MSLDIYLEGEEREVPCVCSCCEHAHTRTERERFFWQNITHNLIPMAEAAGLYGPLWRPEENGIECADQLLPVLARGIRDMKRRPAHYKKMDNPNGWGLYANFVPWLERLLVACEEHPTARVRACR